MFYIYLKYKYRIKNISKERFYYIFSNVVFIYYTPHVWKQGTETGFLKGSRWKNFREFIKILSGGFHPSISWSRTAPYAPKKLRYTIINKYYKNGGNFFPDFIISYARYDTPQG